MDQVAGWLDKEEWEESFELVPRVAVDLVVVRKRWLGKKQILLTKRAREPFVGSWHVPGSFLLKGEKMEECAYRVAREELGVEIKKLWWAGVFENLAGDPRGHVIDLVYFCQVKSAPRAVGDTAGVGWFAKLPEDIGFGQGELLKKLSVL